jgi:hypothetical protein
MNTLFLLCCFVLGADSPGEFPVVFHTNQSLLKVSDPQYKTTYTEPYTCTAPDQPLEGVQCPIPKECRVFNKTGIQCVWASIETLGRWAECKELLEPEALTERSRCKSFAGPSDASEVLNKYKVRFEQSAQGREKGIALIKKAMKEKRACLWSIPGHAMVICHYDEEKNEFMWIDNSDRSLKIQKGTIQTFNKKWDGWILVIYANPDRFERNMVNQIPIIDRNNPQGTYPPDYIPTPKDKQ